MHSFIIITATQQKWIVAEDDNWKEIIISWYKLEQYLLPMLELKRKYYVNEITDLLLSISDKRVKLMNSKQKATNDHNMKNNEHAFEDIGEPYDSRSKHNQQDDIIYDIEDVKDCLEEFQQAIVLVRSILKKAESDTKNRDKLLQELKKVQLENLKQLSAKLEKFIKTKDSTKDVVRQRLLSQFKELNEIYQTQILKNELLKKPIAQQSNKMTAVSHNPKPSTKMVNKGTDTSSDDESGNGELQLQVKQKLTSAQKSTLNVERAIAIETNQKISEIQSEMLQVNEIFRDLNQLLEEQDLLIDVIANNVESANENTKQGNKDLKEAKNLHNFKFY